MLSGFLIAGLWSVGIELGGGFRFLPPSEIPDGKAPRLDLLVVEARRQLPHTSPLAPDRLELQLDWTHLYFTGSGTRWPRLPLTVYGSWLVPITDHHGLALSAGLYTELGRDSFVADEELDYGFGGTFAFAARVGMERPRRFTHFTTVGNYLRGAAGVSFGSDPDHAAVARYLRVGLERSWTWGARSELDR
ncbi:MAG TPA: hypothetical protein QGF58_28710 [Myxococcota bacterium]|nr:hypothetical protein [Myxococcota bacterium]